MKSFYLNALKKIWLPFSGQKIKRKLSKALKQQFEVLTFSYQQLRKVILCLVFPENGVLLTGYFEDFLRRISNTNGCAYDFDISKPYQGGKP